MQNEDIFIFLMKIEDKSLLLYAKALRRNSGLGRMAQPCEGSDTIKNYGTS